MKLKKTVFLLSLAVMLSCSCSALRNDIAAINQKTEMALNSHSACLMEFSSGEVLYEKNPDEKLEPASVTKIMSVLLVMEALDEKIVSMEDKVSSSAHAAEMGGSQIWLEVGEEMTVDEMLKAVMVVSANDCTVALAEHIAGSEETFCARMNQRAKELGMLNTNFVNCTGLPAENHYTTARDIAIMTRELLKHEEILKYTTIWMDTLRDGEMGLSNTNKLIRFYNGANGMKTGFTSNALYCLSGTAKRDGMQLIAAVMKAPTSDKRFEDAKKLLDFGFANYEVFDIPQSSLENIKVKNGIQETVPVSCKAKQVLLPKGRGKNLDRNIVLPEYIDAPVKEGEAVGKVEYSLNGEVVAEAEIISQKTVEKLNVFSISSKILKMLISQK